MIYKYKRILKDVKDKNKNEMDIEENFKKWMTLLVDRNNNQVYFSSEYCVVIVHFNG